MAGVEVFLFAHPDDEFGTFFALEQAVARRSDIVCLYLTDGAFQGQAGDCREAESRRVLCRLGIDAPSIHFVGGREGFGDGELCAHLAVALDSIAEILDPLPKIDSIHMHAWEGGHQDHDAVHLVGVAYAARRGLLGACRQFALYRDGRGPLNLTLCAPLRENGPVDAARIPLMSRLKYLGLCLSYRSQWKTFMVLLPMLLMSYVSKGAQETQGVALSRLFERPHAGPLLYERRGRETFENFRRASEPFLDRFSSSPAAKRQDLAK